MLGKARRPSLRSPRPARGIVVATAVIVATLLSAASPPLRAFEFASESGAVTGYLDTTISFGALWRTQGRNCAAVVDVLRPGHPNPDYARYELHRVWVVEATLKEGARHIYRKRVFYIDEDSWTIAVTDQYDMAGELWRVSEQHSINCYDVPMLYATVEVHSDLKSGRYLVLGLRDGQPRFFEKIKRSSADYTPAVLRMPGVR